MAGPGAAAAGGGGGAGAEVTRTEEREGFGSVEGTTRGTAGKVRGACFLRSACSLNVLRVSYNHE